MKTFYKLILPAILILASCSSKVYMDKAFFSKTQPGTQTLAVLPAEVLFTGNLPKTWGPDRLVQMEAEQSTAFQEAIYQNFLFHAADKMIRNKWDVTMMDIRVINAKLKEQGISLQDSWKLPSDELAELLGADMLIRARVQNVRYMSQAAATGINVGVSVLEGVLSSGRSSVYVPRAVAGESDMSLSLYHESKSEAVARMTAEYKFKVRKLPVYVKN